MMQENYNERHPNDFDDAIDLQELFHALIQGKYIIISVTAFVSILAVIYSLLLPNIYESKALLVPVDSSSSISTALQSYSGLAGLAGINLPSAGAESNSAKALTKIRTLSFYEKNILPFIFLPDLVAVNSWNSTTNSLAYEESIYNKTSNTWAKDYDYPSVQQSFQVFNEGHITITEDKISSFITLSIKHQSPYIAKEWAELIINQVNTFYRQKDKLESQKAISFLNEQIAMTSLSEIKQVIAQLLQQETQKLTLIEANQSYVFDYIDPPAVMELKSGPSRAIICILSALFGGILSIAIVLIRHYGLRKKAS